MIIDCISDLHGYYPKLDGGDLLIVAGDLTARDYRDEYVDFCSWAHNLEYKKVIVISGNHDNLMEREPQFFSSTEQLAYLCDSGTEFEGLKIWGSPWTVKFESMNPKCMAFTHETEYDISHKWNLIPSDTDILVTHSPPFSILDNTFRDENVGSTSLEYKIYYMNLKLHVFGHIHEAYGCLKKTPNANNRYISVNASYVNAEYDPVNKPVRIIL